MNKILGNKKAYFIFVFPAFVIYFVMAFIPIIISCYYSTLEWNGIGQKVFVGIENFLDLLKNDAFLSSVKNSLILAAASVIGQLIPAMFFEEYQGRRGLQDDIFYSSVALHSSNRTTFFKNL